MSALSRAPRQAPFRARALRLALGTAFCGFTLGIGATAMGAMGPRSPGDTEISVQRPVSPWGLPSAAAPIQLNQISPTTLNLAMSLSEVTQYPGLIRYPTAQPSARINWDGSGPLPYALPEDALGPVPDLMAMYPYMITDYYDHQTGLHDAAGAPWHVGIASAYSAAIAGWGFAQAPQKSWIAEPVPTAAARGAAAAR